MVCPKGELGKGGGWYRRSFNLKMFLQASAHEPYISGHGSNYDENNYPKSESVLCFLAIFKERESSISESAMPQTFHNRFDESPAQPAMSILHTQTQLSRTTIQFVSF
jgi:hypothetical protein